MIPDTTAHPRRERIATEAERELDAYNAAFDELELDWHWSRATLDELASISGEQERITAYLRAHRPHLLKVHDAAAIASEIVEVKERMRARSASRGNG